MNKVNLKIIMLLLVTISAINSAFATSTSSKIPIKKVKGYLETWRDSAKAKTKNEGLIWIKRGRDIRTISEDGDSLKKQIDSLFKEIGEIYFDNRLFRGSLNKDGKRMALYKDSILRNAIDTLFQIHEGKLMIYKAELKKEEKNVSSDNHNGGEKNGEEASNTPKSKYYFLHIILLYILFVILLLGILYLLFMLKKLKARDKESIDYLQNKTERPNNNLQELSSLKRQLEQLEATIKKEPDSISEMKKTIKKLQASVDEIKETKGTKEVKGGDKPSKANEAEKAVMLQYYYATPQTDTFAVKVPQADYDAFWVVEVSDENAQTGVYKVNDNKKNQLLSNAEVYLKPFLDIQNMNAVSKPTRIEYLSSGKVTRTAEGYWKLTEKAKVNLL